MTKSWRIDDFMPEAAAYYRELELKFGAEIYHPLQATRFCLNHEDAKRCQRRTRNPRYANVLKGFQDAGTAGQNFADEYGSMQIEGAAWVDLPQTLKVLRNRILSEGSFLCQDFEYEDLQRSQTGWSYHQQDYIGVIFCEGNELKHNPWFQNLPLKPAKGETLLCQSENVDFESNHLIHHEKWFLPYADGSFRIGATYDEGDLSHHPTEEGKAKLIGAFHKLTPAAEGLMVIKHLAGLRPSTADARPLLGSHQTEQGLHVFNGLGSKGASLAPTLSKEFIDYLLDGKPLDPETDIRRFNTDDICDSQRE